MAKKKTNYTQWKTETANAVDLILDPDNIRLELKSSKQGEIINDLFVNEDAYQITKSIVEGGFFPDELPVIIKKGGKKIVIEGNRRIASLKALINPDIAPSHAARIKGMLVGKSFKPIKTVRVVCAPSREDALQLLAMKHTATTRRPWKPLRKAYFYYAQYKAGKTIEELKAAHPDVAVEDYVKMWEMHDIAKSMQYGSSLVEAKVHSQREFPISTLARLYEDPSFREHMGVEFDANGQVKISAVKADFDKAFTQVITDVTTKVVDSRKLNDTKKIKKYLVTVPKPAMQKAGKTISSSVFTPKSIPTGKPKKLVPDGLVCNLQSPGVVRMLEEIRAINYVKFPNATADLLRSLLECSLKVYYIARNETIPHKGRFTFLSDALAKFQADANTPIGLQQLTQSIISGSSFFQSSDFLNAVNHNPHLFATDKEVKEAWDKLEPIFREIYK